MPATEPPLAEFRDLLQALAQAWLQTRDLDLALSLETLARWPDEVLEVVGKPPHAAPMRLSWSELMPPTLVQARTLKLSFRARLLYSADGWRWRIVPGGWLWPWLRAQTHQLELTVKRGDPDQGTVSIDGQPWLRFPVLPGHLVLEEAT